MFNLLINLRDRFASQAERDFNDRLAEVANQLEEIITKILDFDLNNLKFETGEPQRGETFRQPILSGTNNDAHRILSDDLELPILVRDDDEIRTAIEALETNYHLVFKRQADPDFVDIAAYNACQRYVNPRIKRVIRTALKNYPDQGRLAQWALHHNADRWSRESFPRDYRHGDIIAYHAHTVTEQTGLFKTVKRLMGCRQTLVATGKVVYDQPAKPGP